MVVNYPTGFYRDVLPRRPNDVGSVTFTISNSAPPRTNLVFPKVSVGVDRQLSGIGETDILAERKLVGDAAFTTSIAFRSALASNSQQYQFGQVLGFDDVITDSIDPAPLVGPVELRHDVFSVDFAEIGLSDVDEVIIADAAFRAQGDLMVRLNEARQQRANAESAIIEHQKNINNINRTIGALQVVQKTGVTDVSAIVAKMKVELVATTAQLATATAEAVTLADTISDLVSELRTVAAVLS